jgi:hypothetical protein
MTRKQEEDKTKEDYWKEDRAEWEVSSYGTLGSASALPFEPRLQSFYLFFRENPTLTLPQMASDLNPPTSTSWVAGTINMYHRHSTCFQDRLLLTFAQAGLEP